MDAQPGLHHCLDPALNMLETWSDAMAHTAVSAVRPQAFEASTLLPMGRLPLRDDFALGVRPEQVLQARKKAVVWRQAHRCFLKTAFVRPPLVFAWPNQQRQYQILIIQS